MLFDNNYYLLSWRLLDTRIGRWLTTDPAGQFFSPYVSMGNNPVKLYDPGGKDPPLEHEYESGYVWSDADGTWKWNGGAQTWVGFDGVDDIFGYTQYIEEVYIALHYVEVHRVIESNFETLSLFSFGNLRGYVLEPKGPSTIKSNQNRRILPGSYYVQKYSSNNFPNHFRIYNDLVPTDRNILLHSGVDFTNIRGCLVFGDCLVSDGIIDPGSPPMFNQLRDAINNVGVTNVRLRIHEEFSINVNTINQIEFNMQPINFKF